MLPAVGLVAGERSDLNDLAWCSGTLGPFQPSSGRKRFG